jgi:hypothetical protein
MAPEAYMNIDRVGGAEVFGFADQYMSFDWLESMLGNQHQYQEQVSIHEQTQEDSANVL